MRSWRNTVCGWGYRNQLFADLFEDDAVLKEAALAKLERPRQYDLDFLRSWFRRPGMGAFPLLGLDRDAWDAKTESDLIAINPRATPDIFSKWFTESFIPRYHQVFGEKFRVCVRRKPVTRDEANVEQKELPGNIGTGIYHYKESSLESCLGILATVMASLLPICSVVALYLIQSNGLRLGMIAIFSACFSLALAIMTNTRRIEVFAATAAYVFKKSKTITG